MLSSPILSRETPENNAPLVSVILPTFNRAHILERAIRSILNQTYVHLELIVVDDGSKDETSETVRAINDPRIRYVAHKNNRGLAASRNTGIREARGLYIANLDSDDTWLPGKLAREVDEMNRASDTVGIVYSAVRKYFSAEDVRIIPEIFSSAPTGSVIDTIVKANITTMQATLIRARCFADELFDERLPALQDWDLLLRLAQKWHFLFVPEIFTEAYISKDSITKNRRVRSAARTMILEKHSALFSTYPTTYARLAYMTGMSEYRWGERAQAHKLLSIAVRHMPYHPRYMLGYLRTLF